MSIAEQLNELDRKVLGAAPVDRTSPAAPYDESIGRLAPLSYSLALRCTLYGVATAVLGVHMLLEKRWTTLLVVAIAVVVPAFLLTKLSTKAFPVHFPDAPREALARGRAGNPGRLILAGVAAALALVDVILLHGMGEEVLFVLVGLPAVVLWAIHAEVTSREEAGFVLASRVKGQGRIGRGIYRVPAR